MIETIRLCLGAADLLGARGLLRLELQGPPDRLTTGALRVLGARQVAQGALTARIGSRTARRFGSAVDGLHCASMLLLAALDERRRRAALVQASIAALLGAAELGRS